MSLLLVFALVSDPLSDWIDLLEHVTSVSKPSLVFYQFRIKYGVLSAAQETTEESYFTDFFLL